jgi:hypothetical protein
VPSLAIASLMPPPEKILVRVAGQNAVHACAGLAPLERWIGKKRPSHSRTQYETDGPDWSCGLDSGRDSGALGSA